MHDLDSAVAPISSTTHTYTKTLFTRSLPPVANSQKPLPVDKIQPAFYGEPRIRRLSAKQLFNQPSYGSGTKTTYAKPHYFAHIHYSEKILPYLIKERLPDEILPVHSPKLLFGAKFQLDQSGILKQTPSGLVYLDISDDYIHKLYPFFYPHGAEKPPYSAHIPIISEQEASSMACQDLAELGQRFTFTIKDCERITPKHSPETEAIWVLNVESPSLMLLREHHQLPSKLHSHDFAIVLAIKHKKNLTIPKEHECHYFRVNPALSYA